MLRSLVGSEMCIRDRTSAVAIAASPSPRPVNPSPSVVVALTDTGAPAAAPSAASAAARRGPSRGKLPTTCTATLPTPQPAAASRRAVSANSAEPAAPAHRGSAVPKWLPRSPSPAADSSASQAAWAATSPSECPARPGSSGQSRPATQHGRLAANGCTSTPTPTRGHPGTWSGCMPGPASRQQRLSKDHVDRSGHLQARRMPRYDVHSHTDALHQPGVVGQRGIGWRRGCMRFREQLTTEALRSLDRTQLLPGKGFEHPPSLVHPLDGVGHRQRRDYRVVPCLLYTSDAADEEDSVDLGGR